MPGRSRKGGAAPVTHDEKQADNGGTRWRFAPGCEGELAALSDEAFSGLSLLMERHQQRKTRAMIHFKPLTDGMSELLYEHSNNHFRLIFFPHLGSLVGLTAFAKNQEKTPPKDLRRAKQRKRDWEATHSEDSAEDGSSRKKK